MSTNLTGNTDIVIRLKNQKTIDLNTILDELNIVTGIKWTYGTGANQANVVFHDTRTLADGANETLDLYASGTLKDAFGDDLTMSALKLLYVKNKSSDATLKLFGGDSLDIGILDSMTAKELIAPGGYFLWINPTAAGLDVSTNKNLRLEHDGTGESSMDIDVIALGLD